MRRGIIGVAIFVAAYVGLITLYAVTGMGPPHPVSQAGPAADGTTVTVDVEGIQPYKSVLVANLTVAPGPALLDPQTGALKDDLTVSVTSATTPTTRSWPKGTQPGVFPVSLNINGDVSDWPLDSYRSGPVSVDLFRGAGRPPERQSVTFVDRLPGWKVEVSDGEAQAPYRVQVERSPSTIALAVVLLAVLLTLAAVALYVSVQTVRGLRKFQPPMTTWFAAMLFAVMPLRNALPDSPPFGAWIDVTIVVWVIVALVTAMTLYVSCWWRHLAPGYDEPAKSVVERPPAERE
ncbi:MULTISPECIES: DUF4436 domain-containing protein [Mycobacterium]|uniref:DUF4436 domain-containing protein n=1 Tax=Mycobacterium kiyosense TaxID=2871094 RepID=A0A9P3QA07_9MYCO|nr:MULTISPECIES: DUF4436 domain-containing protein [Mycobacterium]BDB40664.1 DUF4436 domain-containing protein [Mycobacterium kiyosense]BDE12475.1 DUF4436 domain-containing protein [Mycobacterium sp. 20KCMC460]GLB85001.1 DUF4436 domain-containing protein [Mycobacterium kiyosense]GLB89791.1 DUF4436 domain-containing protein [Mycobacterium kiyosense]GLB97808.1 DUF4436 domain-containing protein [Mycobacterium kiyosense]